MEGVEKLLAPDKGRPLNCCAIEFRFDYKSTSRGVTQSNALSIKVILDVVWLGRERPQCQTDMRCLLLYVDREEGSDSSCRGQDLFYISRRDLWQGH